MLFDPVCVFALLLPCSQLRPAVCSELPCAARARDRLPGWAASAAAAGLRERDQEGGQEKGKAGTGRKGEARGSKGRQGKAKEGKGKGGNGHEVESPARGHAARRVIDEKSRIQKLGLAEASKARGNRRRAREERAAAGTAAVGAGTSSPGMRQSLAPLIKAHCEVLSLIALPDAALRPAALRPEASCQLPCWLRACDSGCGGESASPGGDFVQLLASGRLPKAKGRTPKAPPAACGRHRFCSIGTKFSAVGRWIQRPNP